MGGKANSGCEPPRAAQDQERSILSVSVTGQIFPELALCAQHSTQLSMTFKDLELGYRGFQLFAWLSGQGQRNRPQRQAAQAGVNTSATHK